MNTWIDGRAGGSIDHRDRGFNYGDGLFETMRVRRGVIRLLGYHLERLQQGCERLGFAAPDPLRLRRELLRHAAARREAVLKLVVTRGVGGRGYRPSGKQRCTRVISLYPLPATARAPGPLRARVCSMRLGSNAALGGLKTLNRLESVLARAEWSDPAIWEGLLRDGDDNIVCGTMSNLFIRRGRVLSTPTVDRCGVAGVMRRWVMECAGSVGLVTAQARLRWEDLCEADEVFMTNAVAGVVTLSSIQKDRVRLRLRAAPTSAQALRALLEEVR